MMDLNFEIRVSSGVPYEDMAPSPGRSTRPAATSHLPLSIHLTTFNPAQPALQNQFSNSTPLRISARNLAAPAIPKQMNCKPLRDRLTETPYERARARPASYTDAEILELAEPGRVISVQQNLTTGERCAIFYSGRKGTVTKIHTGCRSTTRN